MDGSHNNNHTKLLPLVKEKRVSYLAALAHCSYKQRMFQGDIEASTGDADIWRNTDKQNSQPLSACSTAWLYIFWHFCASVICLKCKHDQNNFHVLIQLTAQQSFGCGTIKNPNQKMGEAHCWNELSADLLRWAKLGPYKVCVIKINK